MVTDTIANAITMVKNASYAGRLNTDIPYSRVNEEILQLLKRKSLIEDVKVFKEKDSVAKKINVTLRTNQEKVRRVEVKRISKPGQRKYVKYTDIKPVRAGLGIMVVSTPRGILDGEEARKRKLGGEVLCIAW